VTNVATPINGFHDIPTQDAFVYDGFVVYAPATLGGKKFVPARYVNNRWEYDNDSTFTPFTPQAGDAIIAAFTKDASGITSVTTYDCPAQCAPQNGLAVLELAQGELVPNSLGGGDSGGKWDLGRRDAAELFLHPDSSLRGIVLSNGAGASIELTGVTGIQSGDLLRGVYRFDAVTLKNARVVTEDLFESATAPALDGTSTLVTGNAAAPVIAASGVTVDRGLDGPVLTGTANAVIDPEKPIVLVARNAERSTSTAPVVWNATTTQMLFGTRGGLSVQRPFNGHSDQSCATSTLNAITNSGFVTFMASQTNKAVMAGLAPADTTANATEPGLNGFKLLAGGTYEVWANGANASKNGSYTTSTVFRVEKTPAAIRFLVDAVQVHEVTSSIPAKLVFDISFQGSDSGELHSIEYDTAAANNGTYRIAAASDGSFKLPVAGQPGDTLVLRAWDAHAYPFRSDEVAVATLPNDIGAQSVTFSQSEVIGGRTLTGTATLLAPAGADGARVTLASNNANVTVPASFTIVAGQPSGTFTITTKAVLEPQDAAITATYGGVSASGTFRLTKDSIAPAITITAPLPNAQFNEGSGTKIPLQVTVVDEDAGVSTVVASIDGKSYDLAKDATKGPNVWTAQVPAPFVDGTVPVTMQLSVVATDFSNNSNTASVPVAIKPVADDTVPKIEWSCTSGGIWPSASVIKLRAVVKPPNSGNAINTVTFEVNGQSLNGTNIGSDTYEAQWTAPAAEAQYTVRVIAVAAGGASDARDTTISTVLVDQTLTANTTIGASDTSYDGKSLAVTGGTLTIAGTHAFKHLLILGGSLAHSNASTSVTTTGATFFACGTTVTVQGPHTADTTTLHGDLTATKITSGAMTLDRPAILRHAAGGALALKVTNKLRIEPSASIDVTGRGYAADNTYAGSQTPGHASGGSHIGLGGSWWDWNSYPGTTYGSVYQPREAGGGGQYWGDGVNYGQPGGG
ncbi:MAG: Ig-like domain-containing protein, partial [Thermoanaerobaculia bacterium]